MTAAIGSASAAPLSAVEGVQFTMPLAADPTDCRASIVVINWGDGSPSTTGGRSNGTIDGTHTYAEAGTYDGSVAYTGTSFTEQPCAGSIPFQVAVADGQLTARALDVSAGTRNSFSGPLATFTDANPAAPVSDFSAQIDWGDGTRSTGTVTGSGGSFVVNGDHAYKRPGTFAVGVTISDRDGAGASTRGVASVASGDPRSSLPGPATPIYGQRSELRRLKGRVLVRLPGAKGFVPLDGLSSVPFGSVIDALHGVVQVISAASTDSKATQSARFYEGVFQLDQPAGFYITPVRPARTGRLGPYTLLRLVGDGFGHCTGRAGRARATIARMKRSPRSVRHLWGSGHGHFMTIGRTASAAVRGTIWLTDDRCDGTLVRVARGIVQVSDFPHHRTVAVRVGHEYQARG